MLSERFRSRWWPLSLPVVLIALALLLRVAPAPHEDRNSACGAMCQKVSNQTTQISADDRIANYTALLAWFTGLLAIVSTIQIAFLTKAEKTARLSARAALKSAETSERALIAGQRAFIGVSFEAVAVKNIQTGRVAGYQFSAIWKNAGETPTRNMTNHVNIVVRESELPRSWHFPDLWHPDIQLIDRIPVNLSANAKDTVRSESMMVSLSDVRELIEGAKFAYFYGWARYNDVFPNTNTHITRFAVRIVGGGNPNAPEKMNFNFPFLQRYNCSDEECSMQGYPAGWTPGGLSD